MIAPNVDINLFHQLDIRVGTVIAAESFEKARKPAIKMQIDFGIAGIKKSSAQLTKRYTPQSLIGKQVLAIINLPPRQIADYISECLVLGIMGADGDVVLVVPEQPTPNGLKLG